MGKWGDDSSDSEVNSDADYILLDHDSESEIDEDVGIEKPTKRIKQDEEKNPREIIAK